MPNWLYRVTEEYLSAGEPVAASGALELTGSAEGSVAFSAVASGLLELTGSADGIVVGQVLGTGSGTLELTATAVGRVTAPSLTVIADLPVEWGGSFDLLFTWDTIQRLVDDLLFNWTEVARDPIFNGSLEFTWIELDNLEALTFTWTELPAGLVDAYELDPQRPYGRVSKN